MSAIPCFNSTARIGNIDISIVTEAVSADSAEKINTFVRSSDGTSFSFNSCPDSPVSEEIIREQHEKISSKVGKLFSGSGSTAFGNMVDYGALYAKKQFRNFRKEQCNSLKTVRKILLCDDEAKQ